MKKMSFVSLGCLLSSVVAFPAFAAELNIPPYPLQTTGFVPPNVMFLFDTSGSMGNKLGDQTRLEIAKEVAIDIIDNTSDVRFCLAEFNYKHGGSIVTECDIPPDDSDDNGIIKDIKKLKATHWTPLAEAYYEVVGYFRGGASIYNTDDPDHVSPIQYRCQKNFAIVLTDGVPYFDKNFPGLDGEVSNRSVVFGDYDGEANDGDLDNDDDYERYLFLDDIAKLAYETDLRTTGLDEADKSFNDSLFAKQNLSTYTVGFALDDTDALNMLRDAAEKEGYGHGKYFNAQSADDLKNSFSNALTQITKTSQSVAASSSNSGELSAGSMLYQSRYIASVWEGEVLALPISPETLTVADSPAWRASLLLQAKGYSNRRVFTGHTADADHDGSVFKKAAFTSAQKNEYFGLDNIDFSNSRNMIQYIKGKAFDAHFRERESILGDIVNSKPIYVGKPDGQSKFLSEAVTSDASLITSYGSFVEDQASRKNMIYVGANDGMLHAFNADTGNEQYAYIPTLVIPQLKELAKKDYQHRFYVDGTVTVENVYFDGHWRSILVGGLGRGGKGLYALDVTETD
ncbi:MAG: VWA domain-containing protein, partial [Pseudomonadales bacterium]|nr:VWA domain-containing protein [Pseudomonadales bacterium]